MADPLLLVAFAILAIVAVSVWVSFAPSDRTMARAHRVTDKQTLHEEVPTPKSSHGGVAEIPMSSRIALCLLLLNFGMAGWYVARPYVIEPWQHGEVGHTFFWLTAMVYFAATPAALIFAVCGALVHRTKFAKTIFALTIVPVACGLGMCVFGIRW